MDKVPDVDDGLTREHLLLSYDLAMMATARRYNLDNQDHRHHSNSVLTRLFFDMCSLNRVDLFVEAGAMDASASRRARAWFHDLRVVAFEASPLIYEHYAEVNDKAGIEYLNRAVTDKAGTVTFNVHRDADGKPVENGEASLLRRNKARADAERGFEEFDVEGVSLDEFFVDQAFERAAVWIDVEGACKFVLPGAREVLKRTAVLLIEVEDQRYWGEDHWIRSQVMSFLFDLGLVPVARDYEYLHQHNLLFVRRELLTEPNRNRHALARFVSRAVDPPRPKRPATTTPPPPTTPKVGPGATLREQARRAFRNLLSRRKKSPRKAP